MMRVRTAWHRKAPRGAEEQASVLAATLWKSADRMVENLSRAGFTIGTPSRGMTLIAETLAFTLHFCDRLAHRRLGDAERSALLSHTGTRLAELMETNGGSYRGLVALLNERAEEYAHFDFPADLPEFAALRCFALHVREAMTPEDRTWVMDQVMEIEAPEIIGAGKKVLTAIAGNSC
jgi:hypothetical protein